tara:strand:+ start:1484 stop:1693 length:210 start_codon:yes stop_codon:yes gene_type:complete
VKCFDCGNDIPAARIQAVPDTEYCVQCVDKHTEPVVGRMIYSHKTAGELVFASGKENIRRLNREYERAR